MPAPAPASTPDAELMIRLRGDRTQSTFAEVLGVEQPTISKVETGYRQITPQLAYRLIARGGADVQELEALLRERGYLLGALEAA